VYKLRHLEGELRRMAKLFKVILITGARQVGKSTLLRHTFPEAKVITFEPGEDLYQARQDPAFFFASQPRPLILDEIQYAPELLPKLKRIVDEDPACGQYFLTGSHNLNVLKTVSESLAGRVGILDLSCMTTYEQNDSFVFNKDYQQEPPLWLAQYLKHPTLLVEHITGTTSQPVANAIWRGGMPATLMLPDESLTRYFSSYLQTYIQRDVRELAKVGNIDAFQQFVRIISSLSGQEINTAQLGREADIDPRTARDWLRILGYGYQWHEILPYSRNAIKQVVSSKTKGFFSDTGLACHLLRLSSPDAVLAYASRGALFETLVVNTITTMLHVLGDAANIFYWRTRNGAEVDLVLEHNGALYPIEIKMKATLNKNDTSGLRAFKEFCEDVMPVKTALLIYTGEECYWFDKNTIALPWNAICKAS